MTFFFCFSLVAFLCIVHIQKYSFTSYSLPIWNLRGSGHLPPSSPPANTGPKGGWYKFLYYSKCHRWFKTETGTTGVLSVLQTVFLYPSHRGHTRLGEFTPAMNTHCQWRNYQYSMCTMEYGSPNQGSQDSGSDKRKFKRNK